MKITDTIQGKVTIGQKRIVWQDFSLVLLGAMVLSLLIVSGERMTLLHPLRIVLGLAYVLFIPGYCLTTALFPRVDDLDHAERLGLSIGFSIASVSILALGLDWLHLGLSLWPILLGEYGITALFIAVTLWRRSQLPVEMVYRPRLVYRPWPWWNSLSISNRRLYKMLLVGLLLISGLAAWIFLTPTPNQFMTEFYLLGPDGFVADYPYRVGLNDEVTVTVGVINREKREFNYHFEVWVTDSLNLDRRELVMQSDSFSLRLGEKNEQSVSWHMPWVGDDQKVEFLLFNGARPEPYRQLRLWVNVVERR